MAVDTRALRDWHRLFGLFLTDFFTGSPFAVEVERDLSQQQQFLDVVIVRRGRGKLAVRLPDGLDDLGPHNLISFKSHREALDAWAMKDRSPTPDWPVSVAKYMSALRLNGAHTGAGRCLARIQPMC